MTDPLDRAVTAEALLEQARADGDAWRERYNMTEADVAGLRAELTTSRLALAVAHREQDTAEDEKAVAEGEAAGLRLEAVGLRNELDFAHRVNAKYVDALGVSIAWAARWKALARGQRNVLMVRASTAKHNQRAWLELVRECNGLREEARRAALDRLTEMGQWMEETGALTSQLQEAQSDYGARDHAAKLWKVLARKLRSDVADAYAGWVKDVERVIAERDAAEERVAALEAVVAGWGVEDE